MYICIIFYVEVFTQPNYKYNKLVHIKSTPFTLLNPYLTLLQPYHH